MSCWAHSVHIFQIGIMMEHLCNVSITISTGVGKQILKGHEPLVYPSCCVLQVNRLPLQRSFKFYACRNKGGPADMVGYVKVLVLIAQFRISL